VDASIMRKTHCPPEEDPQPFTAPRKKPIERVHLSARFAGRRRIVVTDSVRPPLDKEQDEKLRTENALQHG
jgi:hypothetical protein